MLSFEPASATIGRKSVAVTISLGRKIGVSDLLSLSNPKLKIKN
jgi:hypothetical protein